MKLDKLNKPDRLDKLSRLNKPNERQHCSTATLNNSIRFASNLQPLTSNDRRQPNKLNKPNKLFPLALCFLMGLIVLSVSEFAHADVSDIFSGFQFFAVAEETYDSNVNLTPRNKKDDYITRAGVGIRFSTLPQAETTREFRQPSTGEETAYGINLDFLPAYVFYAKDTSDDYLSLAGNLNTWYTWDRRLTLRVNDYLIRSEEPLERDYTPAALPGQILLGNQIGRSIYIRNVFQPSLEYRFGKEDVISINYINNVYRNESSFFEDSTENSINPSLTYWFNIRNGVSFNYGLTLADFERSSDFTGHTAAGRYTYRFNPRTSVFGDFTYLKRDFDQPSPDYDVYRPSFGVEHAFSSTLSAQAQAGYFLQNPSRGSTEDGFFYSIAVTQRAKKTTYTLGLQGGYTEDYFTADNLGFGKYHQAIGTITHQLAQRISATLSGRYQRPEYTDGRTDNIWGVNAGVSYQILRWLSCGINLAYEENDSNRNINDYTDFRAIFRITATL